MKNEFVIIIVCDRVSMDLLIIVNDFIMLIMIIVIAKNLCDDMITFLSEV